MGSSPASGFAAGIDVASQRLHCVRLHADGRVGSALFEATELPTLVEWLRGARVVAVDAPAELSVGAHRDDDLPLGRKFRAARCAEVALGRVYGIWVPWVGPEERPADGWMATGFAVYDALEAAGLEAIEVFPHAAFRLLLGVSRIPRKGTLEGTRARVVALEAEGVAEENLRMWSHDGLDALVAAVVARDYAAGVARRVTCGHDASAIWLPAPGSE